MDTKQEEIERLMADEERDELRCAVEKLPQVQKEVVRSFYFDDLTYEQISKKMKLPINTVRSHLFRAKAALKKIIWQKKN